MEDPLETYLKEEGVVGIYGVDTRELTKILREEGAMNARISDKPLTDAEIKALADHTVSNGLTAVELNTRRPTLRHPSAFLLATTKSGSYRLLCSRT